MSYLIHRSYDIVLLCRLSDLKAECRGWKVKTQVSTGTGTDWNIEERKGSDPVVPQSSSLLQSMKGIVNNLRRNPFSPILIFKL